MKSENIAFSLSSKTASLETTPASTQVVSGPHFSGPARNSAQAALLSRILAATVVYFACFALPAAHAQESHSAGNNVVVQDKFGGQIFGYGVDQNGTEGLLSEIVTLSDGKLLIATETFSQKTGKIVKVVEKKNETQDNFVTWGVYGSHIGLVELEHEVSFLHIRRSYNVLNPLSGNKITGKWTPPVGAKTIIEDVEGVQGTPNVVAMASPPACCSRFIFSSDIAANTFGKKIQLTDPIFTGGVPPTLAYDSTTNQAILAQAQGAFGSTPEIAIVDLASGKTTEFTGLGGGFVNGLAVDSGTGIACTTTQSDFSAEFYDLAKQTGIIVVLPNIGMYSGATVAVDPVNKLFFIAHPVPAATGEIHIYDEKGNLINSLSGFTMGPGGTTIALNPSKRTGFVQAPGSGGGGSALQSFNY